MCQTRKVGKCYWIQAKDQDIGDRLVRLPAVQRLRLEDFFYLQDYIYVRFLSIEETSEKAARQFESTLAVFRLTELLTKSKKIEEVEPKKGTKNQQKFVKILIMRHENIKMTVGVQKSGNKIQYCITALGE